MDELSSTEFRKQYARLTETTRVTVNGHTIGAWIPEARLVRDLESHWDLKREPSTLNENDHG